VFGQNIRYCYFNFVAIHPKDIAFTLTEITIYQLSLFHNARRKTKKTLMETLKIQQTATVRSNKVAFWTGRVISALCIPFLLVDGGMKIVRATASMDGSV
jgi:hypothetical protein